MNGFAALDDQKKPKQEDEESNKADSLFGDDLDTPVDNDPGAGVKVKSEEPGASGLGSHGSEVPPGQPDTAAIPNLPPRLHKQGPNSNSEGASGRDTISAVATEDSDDDLMIVDEDAVPAHVKAMFAANQWMPREPDIEIVRVRVKQEPQSPQPIISLVEDNAVPDFKREPRANSQSASLFGGDVFGDDDKAEAVPNPPMIPAPAPAVQEDDEAMFVDEVFPAAGNKHAVVEVDNSVKAVGVGASRARAAEHGANAAQRLDAVDEPAPAASAPSAEGAGPSATHEPQADTDNDGPDGSDVNGGGEGQHAGDEEPANVQGEDNEDAEDNDDDDDAFVIGEDQELSDGELPRSPRRKAAQRKKAKGKALAVDEEHDFQNLDDLSLADLRDEWEIVQAELRVYNLRKAKDKLGPSDSDRLKALNDRCTELQGRLEKSRHSVSEFANDELRRMMEGDDSDNDDGAQPPGRGQAESSKKQKSANRLPAMVRRDVGRQGEPRAQKRKWKPMPLSAEERAKKRKTRAGEDSTTGAILDMILSQDPIAARARMNDEDVFDKIDANTVKAQMAKLQEQIDADPAADKKRVKEDVKKLTWARKLFGGKRFCKPDNGQWLITGLRKRLHHYQLLGAGWMLGRELHPAGPFGGILADSVGLGKTIEALACILGNMQKEEDRTETKLGTLIVVPPNVLAQWQDETDVCCPELRVTRYYSSKHNRVRMSDLLRADIVLTSYHEVLKAYPNKEKMKAYENLPEAEQAEKFKQALGWLFKVEWYRVILDEAHCIKNSSTHTFNACNNLKGKYRWALTATPVHNGVHEVYPYAKFLRDANAEIFKNAKHKNPEKRADAKHLMKIFLDDVCLNRKIGDLFLGKALFKIPTTHPLPNIWIDLSEEEFFIYKYSSLLPFEMSYTN